MGCSLSGRVFISNRAGGLGERTVGGESGGTLFTIGRQGGDGFEIDEAFYEGVALFAVGDDDIFDGDGHIIAEHLP